jgi:hypothetical protein
MSCFAWHFINLSFIGPEHNTTAQSTKPARNTRSMMMISVKDGRRQPAAAQK